MILLEYIRIYIRYVELLTEFRTWLWFEKLLAKVVLLEFSGASFQVKYHQCTAPGGKMHRILGFFVKSDSWVWPNSRL